MHHYRYPAQGTPRGIVFMFHDQSKYLGKYAHIAEHLASRDIEVFGFDLKGHGKSSGTPRGYFGTFNDVKMVAKKFISEVVKKYEYQGISKFTLGISTGALTALSLAMENERYFKGVNIICPLIQNEGVRPKGITYIDFIGRAFPKLGLMNVDVQSAQPFPDPLLLKGKLRAGLFKELEDTTYYIRNNADKLTVPLLCAHGGIDSITSPKVVREFFNQVSTQDKDIILYDD
jgi:alpha-beta hydrolase superfamily lysophospholipase